MDLDLDLDLDLEAKRAMVGLLCDADPEIAMRAVKLAHEVWGLGGKAPPPSAVADSGENAPRVGEIVPREWKKAIPWPVAFPRAFHSPACKGRRWGPLCRDEECSVTPPCAPREVARGRVCSARFLSGRDGLPAVNVSPIDPWGGSESSGGRAKVPTAALSHLMEEN